MRISYTFQVPIMYQVSRYILDLVTILCILLCYSSCLGWMDRPCFATFVWWIIENVRRKSSIIASTYPTVHFVSKPISKCDMNTGFNKDKFGRNWKWRSEECCLTLIAVLLPLQGRFTKYLLLFSLCVAHQSYWALFNKRLVKTNRICVQ